MHCVRLCLVVYNLDKMFLNPCTHSNTILTKYSTNKMDWRNMLQCFHTTIFLLFFFLFLFFFLISAEILSPKFFKGKIIADYHDHEIQTMKHSNQCTIARLKWFHNNLQLVFIYFLRIYLMFSLLFIVYNLKTCPKIKSIMGAWVW